MKRMLLTIAYDGTAFHGWQVQPNGITVQETLQNALERLLGTRPAVTAAAAPTRAYTRGSFAATSTARKNFPKVPF